MGRSLGARVTIIGAEGVVLGDSILNGAISEAGVVEEALAILGFLESAGPGLKVAETVTRETLTSAGSGDAPLCWKP